MKKHILVPNICQVMPKRKYRKHSKNVCDLMKKKNTLDDSIKSCQLNVCVYKLNHKSKNNYICQDKLSYAVITNNSHDLCDLT